MLGEAMEQKKGGVQREFDGLPSVSPQEMGLMYFEKYQKFLTERWGLSIIRRKFQL